MSTKKVYDEASVVKSISKKKSISVSTVNKIINVDRNATDVGNGTWGKIDYLCKVHGYTYAFMSEVVSKARNKKVNNDEEVAVNNKAAKREAKLNMATMAKSAMRRVKAQ
jgi:hypothetical protein